MASKFTITAELNLQTKNLNQVVNNLRQQFQGANLNINIKDLAQAQSQINKISSSAQNAQKSVGLLGSSFSQAFKKFTIVTAVTGTIVGFTRAVKNAVGDAIEFEREVVKIAQATGKTTSQLKGLTNEISSVSTSFGVSSKELILAARSLTQAGFAADKVTGALKILAQTELAATFDSIQDTTEGAIALLNQFGKQAQRTGSEVAFLEKSFSAINQVSKEFAVESSDLVTAVRTTGSAFESAGGSLDELLALFTSVRATTRESAESIATGFRTIFTRVQRVDTINNLKALGIELQDAEGKFIGPIEATKKLSAALNSIDPRDFRFNLVVEELGGFRQVSKVIPLIQQFAVTQKALNVAQGSSGSLAKDAQTAQQSLAVQIAKTREEFSRFIRDLTGTDSFQSTVRFLLDLANAFVRVADSIKPLVPLIAGFATLKAGTAVKGAFDQLAGPRRKAQGGKIHAFANGGLVPGQGNGDTVPAMLTPGEFVIKKSSVKSLGVENLARANKYAAGGKVQYYTEAGEVKKDDISRQYAEDASSFSIKSVARAGSAKEALQKRQDDFSKIPGKARAYGAAFLRPVGEDKEYSGYVTKAEILKKFKIPKNADRAKKFGQSQYPFTITLSSVNEEVRDTFQKSILNGISDTVDNTAKEVFNDSMALGPIPKGITYKTLKKSNLDQTVGNLFEATLKSLSGKFTNDDKVGAGNQTFDFPTGLGDASRYFNSGLANVRTDAKATYNLQSLQSLVEKVKADIKEEYIPTTKKEIQKVEKSQTGLRVNAGPDKALVENLKQMAFDKYDKNLITGSDGVASYRLVPSTVRKGIDKKGKLSTDAIALINANLKNEKWNTLSLADVEGKSEFLKEVLGFANGGVASGSDTVPAMLTPGEYVINKKSAQAIGYGSLNRMNKVGKFAEGGPVQMYQTGTPTGGASSPRVFQTTSTGVTTVTNQAAINAQAQQQSFIERLKESSDKLLLLGAVAGSVTSQLGGLDQATADIVSSFGATFATIKGIGGNLIDLGSNIKGVNPKVLSGVLTGLSAGLTGFATAQAVAAARVTYLGQTAEESGKKFNSFIEALSKGEGTTQGQLTDALTKQFQAASEAQARGSGAAKAAGGVASLVAGGGAIALGAGAFAPIIAAVAGPLTEEILYSIGAFSDSTGKAKVQAEALSAAMFSATTSNRDFQKFFQNIEKQTPQDVAQQAQSLAQAYKEQQAQIAKLGDLSNASEAVKQQFQAVSESAKQTAANLQTIIGIQLQNAVKRSSDLLNKGFIPDIDKLLKPIFDSIRSAAVTRYSERIKTAGGEQTAQGMNLVGQRENEIARDQENARKTLNQATKQQLEMIAVLNIENNIRKELIGSLQKQSAISASIERLSYELDLASKSVSNIDAAFSGSITGLKSSFDTDILKLKSPDQGALDKALDPVRAIGPIGRDLADNLVNINQVMPTLEAKLIEFSNATDTASGALFDVKKFVEESFNIKADSIVGRTLVKIIEGTTTGTGGEKAVTAAKTSLRQEDVRKKIVESFQKFGEEFRTQAGGILDNLARAEQEGRAVAEKINESRQKQLDLQLQSVDTFSNYIDALAKARGRDLSLIEKNTIRTMKQYTLAGNMANNVGAISTELSGIYKKLNEGGLNLDEQKNLSFSATKLRSALEDLADQSGKTSDILAEIEKQRAKRESARDFGKEFTFGSNEQRQSIANSIQGLQRVLNTGNINDVPEELRSGVSSLLDRFKDVPVFNGRTGRQVENKLIANQFRAMGGGAFANMIEADTSTPEQILIGELQRTFAIQIQAQQALSLLEQQKQELLQGALNEYTTAIGSYTAKLESLVQEFQRKAEEKAIPTVTPSVIASPKTTLPAAPFSGGSMGVLNTLVENPNPNLPPDAKAKIDVENIQETNAVIADFQQAIDFSDQKIYEFTSRLENLVKVMEQNSDRFKEEAAKKKAEEQNKTEKEKREMGLIAPLATGGLVYRAGGGSIFQPKGTDTVPAMLTPGEFVIKKSSVDKIGADNLSALNNGYASGGLVSYLAGGGGASGTNAFNDLAKRVTKLEEQVKKLEKENKILKGSLGKISPMNQIAGGMQNMQQMMSGMQNPQQMMGGMSYGDMMNQRYSSGGGGTRRQLRARQRANESRQENAAKDDANYFSVPNAQQQQANMDASTASVNAMMGNANASSDLYGLKPGATVGTPTPPVPPQQAAATTATAAAATGTAPGIMSADKQEAILNNPAIMNNPRAGEKPENQLALDLLNQEHSDEKDRRRAAGIQPLPENFVGPLTQQQTREQAALAAINKQKKIDIERANEGDYIASKAGDAGRITPEMQKAKIDQLTAENKTRVEKERAEVARNRIPSIEEIANMANSPIPTYERKPQQTPEQKAVQQAEARAKAMAKIDEKYKKIQSHENAGRLFEMGDYNTSLTNPTVQKNLQEISEKRSRVNAQKEAMDLYFGPEMSYAPVDTPGLSDRKIQSFDKPKENPTVQENFRKSRELLFDDKQAKEDAKNYYPNMGQAALDTLKIGATVGGIATLGTLGGIGIGAGIVSALPAAAGGAGALGETILPTVTQARHLGTFAGQLESAGSAALPALESAGSAANTALPMARNLLALPGFARGGSTDTIPAMLTPGEFVMKKDSVSKYGKSFMEKMNKGGVVPGFADGGYVGYYAGGGVAATIANRKARGMNDGQMMTNAQAMQRSVGMRQNMMSNQFANNPAVQQGVMANPMQKPATGGGNTTGAVGGGMSDAAQQFSQFVTQFSDAAKMMTGMTMTHKVTVDGQLNIGGIDGNAVAEQIKIAIGNYVGKIVEDKMSKKMGEAT
jgi:hypothetical protein